MSSRWAAEKHQVAETARKMLSLGLVSGTSGNVSLRLVPHDNLGELMAMTPMGTAYGTLADDDIAVVDFDVEPVEGDLPPSSESLLHTAIYRARSDAGAVIHTHSVFSGVAAVSGLEIPPIIDEMMVVIGGPVKVSQYAFPGSQELAENVCAALGERGAALIKNHGAVGVGRDLEEALNVCALLERAAQVFVYSTLLGRVNTLPPEVVDAEVAIYRMRRQASTGGSAEC